LKTYIDKGRILMKTLMHRIARGYVTVLALLAIVPLAGTTGYTAEKPGTPQIVYVHNLLSVDAVNVQPEALFTTLGKTCNIEVIVHGEVFPETLVSIQFSRVPVKEAVKRLLKACALRSYVLDLQGEKPEIRIAKLELFVSGSGERVLTRSAESLAQSHKAEKPQAERQEAIDQREDKNSSVKDSGNSWDGSAMLDFPKYSGEVPYDKSSYKWQGEAKDFAKQSMDIMPPEVRDGTAEAFIRTCDEIAKEKGSDSITVDITSAALERLARTANMPPELMKYLPKTMADMNKPRVPIDPGHLKP
jgi:hypothetical protein